jgi:crossover junction endodeoxyribonuclease RuvC
MALAIYQIPHQLVTAAKWKKYFNLSQDKGISRRLASERFPHDAEQFSRVKDDGRAEAALLALYAAETFKLT